MEKFMDIDHDKSGIITIDDFMAYTMNARNSETPQIKESFFRLVFYDVMNDITPPCWRS